MDPERWAQITGAFAVERGENAPDEDQVGARVQGMGKIDGENIDVILRDIVTNSNSLSNENLKIIDTLKAIIREKAEKIRHQEEMISALQTKQDLNAKTHEKNEASTQVDISEPLRESFYPHHHHHAVHAAVNSTEIASAENCGGKELEVVKAKIEGLEEKFDGLLAFIQSQFAKFPVDCGNGSSKIPGTTTYTNHNKPWNKPPSLRPKPTSGSILRETYCRNRGPTNRAGGSHDGSLGNKISSCGNTAFSAADQDYQMDELEQRLQFLESLVAQMKIKLMRVITLRLRKSEIK